MISKEKALATADVLMAPADAKRRRQVEARQQRWFGVLPGLSTVPEADRPAVLQAAQRYAGRRWYVYAPILIIAVWTLLSLAAPQLLEAASIGRPPSGLFLLVMFVSLALQRYVMRSYVKREAAKYSQTGQ